MNRPIYEYHECEFHYLTSIYQVMPF